MFNKWRGKEVIKRWNDGVRLEDKKHSLLKARSKAHNHEKSEVQVIDTLPKANIELGHPILEYGAEARSLVVDSMWQYQT